MIEPELKIDMMHANPLNPNSERFSIIPRGEETTSINMLPYISQIVRRWRTITVFVALGIVVSFVLCWVLPPRFTAESSFLPPGSNSAASTLASQLGALSSVGILGETKSPGELYVGILQSHTVAQMLVDRFHLLKIYKVSRDSIAQRILLEHTKIDVDPKDPIIKIAVTETDRTLSRDIANGYLDAIKQVTRTFAITEAAQKRQFFEHQVAQENEALNNAELQLKSYQEKTGLVLPAGQSAIQIERVAQTRAEIDSKNVELSALRQSATDQNPELIRLRSEIADLDRQLQEEQSGGGNAGNLPISVVPQEALDAFRLQREVKYHETLLDLLSRQYESARLDEDKEGSTFQILDMATIPDIKSGPSRLLIMLGGVVSSGICGVIYILLSENITRIRNWAVLLTQPS